MAGQTLETPDGLVVAVALAVVGPQAVSAPFAAARDDAAPPVDAAAQAFAAAQDSPHGREPLEYDWSCQRDQSTFDEAHRA